MSCGWHDNGDPTLRSFDIVLIIGSILDSPDVPSSEGSEKRTPCTPTTDQLKNSGPVTFGGVSSSAYFLLGFGGTQGTFTTQSGLAGDFTATAFGFGLGPSFAVTGGMDDSLASFMGGSDNINIGAFGAEATFSQSIYGGPLRFDSGTLGTDLGLGAVLANALKTPSLASVNVSVTFEVTEISNVTCPVE